MKSELEERFPDADVYMDSLSLSISCHIGPGAVGVGAIKKKFEV